ncbi:MAG: hypothetical protein IJR46_06830 [Neisseriaceae bacterium]|nr:hypothetical protein [Neisseriaceae bacterium]
MMVLHILFPLLMINGILYIFGIYKLAKILGFVDNFFTFFFFAGFNPDLKKLVNDVTSFRNISVPENKQHWVTFTKISLIVHLFLFLLWILSFVIVTISK